VHSIVKTESVPEVSLAPPAPTERGYEAFPLTNKLEKLLYPPAPPPPPEASPGAEPPPPPPATTKASISLVAD
jgi:hypothetical protein